VAEITPYNDELHRAQILDLFSDVAFKGDIWKYQFVENPGAVNRGFDPVVAVDQGRVIGFNGVVPVSITWRGQPIDAMWSCDFKVRSDYRGKGVGRLIKEDLAKKSSVLMSFGISPVAAIVLERMGWHASHDVHFLKRICKPRSFRDVALMVYQFLGRLGAFTAPQSGHESRVRDELPAPAEVDGLWQQSMGGYDKTVVRDWRYLDWRYQKHPLAEYKFIEIFTTEGQLAAVGVVRVDQQQARLVDYLGPAKALPLKYFLVKTMLSTWPELAAYSAMTSDVEFKQAMRSLGFYQGREQPRFFVWASPQMADGSNPGPCNQGWFIMGGDSDGELLQSARESWNHQVTNRDDV